MFKAGQMVIEQAKLTDTILYVAETSRPDGKTKVYMQGQDPEDAFDYPTAKLVAYRSAKVSIA